MKCQLNVRLIACGKFMLAEIANDIETKNAEDMNYTRTFDDGGYVKCTTDIQIVGRDVVIHAVLEGSGDMFDEKMKEMEHQVKTRELQNSFKRDYNRYGPDNTCSRVVATFTFGSC